MEYSGGDSGGQCDVDYACPTRTVCPGSSLGGDAVGAAAVCCVLHLFVWSDGCWLFTSTYVPGDNQVQSRVGLEVADQRGHPYRIVSYLMSSVSSIETFIAHPPLIVHSSLSQLRYLVLSEGMPASNERSVARCRAHVWSILSRTSMEGSTSLYLSLVSRGPPPAHVYQKIKNDTFRTLNTDRQFSATVSEDSLVRCLSCFAWHQLESSSSRNVVSSYVQGMNVLLAPLLYTCPSEPMAYQLFSKLCLEHIPTYLNNQLSGVHNAAKLLDRCLQIIDPKLSKFLTDHLLTAEIYGIPSILTLSSCTRPLHQVCKLWDFMFAYGFHMNILFIVAQLVVVRAQIMSSDSPMNLLRNFPEFDADDIIRLGVGFVAKLPSKLYDLLVHHTLDFDLVVKT